LVRRQRAEFVNEGLPVADAGAGLGGGQGRRARPRLLFLCHTLPFPPDGGVWIRTYNVLNLLSREFDVTALCFERAGAPSDAHDVARSVAALRRLGRVESFAIPQMRSRARLIWDHLRSLLTLRAFTYYRYDAAPFRIRLQQILDEGPPFDIVHVDSLDLVRFLPMLPSAVTVCVHHNVESELLRRRARTETSSPIRAYLALQARLTEDAERRWCSQVALNVCVSPEDATTLERIAAGGSFEVVPNGVDTEFFHPSERPRRRRVVFVGGSTWFPNRDALDYFCAQILPLLRGRFPDLEVSWVGASRPGDIEWYWKRWGVNLTGYVKDVRPYVWDSECFVVPLRVGGGSRLKILDAWAMGMPLVSTTVGCEGLSAVDGENLLIADTAADFASKVAKVLEDRRLAAGLGRHARATVEREYAWDRIGERMLPHYRSLVAPATAATPVERSQRLEPTPRENGRH
jgi:glycosyltransferase involved in cell wall biosynthesis